MRDILVAEDRDGMRDLICKTLGQQGYRVRGVRDGREALAAIQAEAFHLLVTDLRMPGMDGLALLRQAREVDPSLRVILVTAFATVDVAIRALREGANDFLTKPFELADLLARVAHVLEPARLRKENAYLHEELSRQAPLESFVAESPAMKRVTEMVDRVAATDSTVLLCGETGTGKGMVARLLHSRSGRREKPFVHVSCAAFSSTLLESELFGHEKGAFTGARDARAGRFEVADGGTLFLDEIGEVPLEIQVKLLRVVQDRQFERVGSSKVSHVDVRWITATHRDLEASIRAGTFREDLFYRFNVFPIWIPPLRDRREDLPILAAEVLRRLRARLHVPPPSMSAEAQEILFRYPWPGNVRELENVLERAMLLSGGDTLRPEHFAFGLGSAGPATEREPGVLPGSGKLPDAVREKERELIERALEAAGGNRSRAARMLGLSRTTLQYKISRLGLSGDAGQTDGIPSV